MRAYNETNNTDYVMHYNGFDLQLLQPGRTLWVMSNVVYYISNSLVNWVQVQDSILSIAHIYDPQSSLQTLKSQSFATIHMTEYDMTIQTQHLQDTYSHPTTSLQNYSTYVNGNKTIVKSARSDFTEHESLELARFDVKDTERYYRTTKAKSLMSSVSKTIVRQ